MTMDQLTDATVSNISGARRSIYTTYPNGAVQYVVIGEKVVNNYSSGDQVIFRYHDGQYLVSEIHTADGLHFNISAE